MKKSVLGIMGLWIAFVQVDAQVAERLQKLGMENIQSAKTGENTVVSFENSVFRGTVRGIAKAVEAGLNRTEKGGLEMVVLDNGIPQICISLPDTLIAAYQKGEMSLKEIYRHMGIGYNTDQATEVLRKDKEVIDPSNWKADIVIYPEVLLENFNFDKLYSYAVNLSPTLELSLWRGGMLTAQAVIPVATNLHGEYKRVRPGVIALSQEFRLKGNFFGRIDIGNFTNNRIGAQAEVNYRTGNGRLELGAELGTTGYSAITSEGWYIGTRQRVTGALTASVYVPQLNTQLAMRAGRYLYGDYGVRGDCTRHFGEYAVGVYAMYVEGEINGGFHFAIPIPGKKRPKRKRVRVMQPEYFDWQYSMTPWGKYFHEQMGKTFETRPDENQSSHYFQPEFIRYFLQKETMK